MKDKAIITIEDGNSNLVETFQLEYTSFPLVEYTLFLIEGILLLPSEYSHIFLCEYSLVLDNFLFDFVKLINKMYDVDLQD